MLLTHRVEKLANEPILIVKFLLPPLSMHRMFENITAEALTILERHEGKMFRINDFTALNHVPIFSEVVQGMALETRQRPGTSSDPRFIPIFVGKSKDVKLLVEALKQEQYGGYIVPLFPTLDEALAQIRAWIASNNIPEVARQMPEAA